MWFMTVDQPSDDQRVVADLHVLDELWGPGWDAGIPDETREDVGVLLGHGQHAA
jgi:hypothetical protein